MSFFSTPTFQGRLTPFMHLLRWHTPTGAFLLWIPCLWGLIAGFQGLPPLNLALLFLCGAFLMRSAGCVYNDWVDQDLDRYVARTAVRPLAAGTLSTPQALMLLVMLLGLSLVILLQFNLQTIKITLVSLLLVALYPWAKRVTFWPQLVLGFTFNWGVWSGWAASGSPLTVKPLVLYLVGVLWTLAYDTFYAYQDCEDDKRIGVKSLALYLGEKGHPFIRGCWGGMLALLIFFGYLENLHVMAYGVGLGVVAGLFLWQDRQVNLQDPATCGKAFGMNPWIGISIGAALLAGYTF